VKYIDWTSVILALIMSAMLITIAIIITNSLDKKTQALENLNTTLKAK